MAVLSAQDVEDTLKNAVHVPRWRQKAGQLVKAQKMSTERVARAADPGVKKDRTLRQARTAVLTSAIAVDRTFLALALQRNNYRIVFLEFDQEIVNLVNNTGSYTVSEFDEQGVKVRSVVISDCRAIHAAGPAADAIHAISEADIVTCTLPPVLFDELTPNLARGIQARDLQRTPRPLIVITCHRRQAHARTLSHEVELQMNEHTRRTLPQKVIYTNSTIDVLMTPNMMPHSLNMGIEKSPKWYITTRDLGRHRPTLKLVDFVDNIRFYIKRNTEVLDTALAMVAYLGLDRGISDLHHAMHVPSIVENVRRALCQASLLLGGYSNPHGGIIRGQIEYVDSLIRRLGNPALQITCAVRAAGPLYKLQTQRLLIRPACRLARLELDYDGLLKGIEMALRYHWAWDDPNSLLLYRLLSSDSAEGVARTILNSSTKPVFPKLVEIIGRIQREIQLRSGPVEPLYEGSAQVMPPQDERSVQGAVVQGDIRDSANVRGGIRGVQDAAGDVRGGVRGGANVRGGIRGVQAGDVRGGVRGSANVRGGIRGVRDAAGDVRGGVRGGANVRGGIRGVAGETGSAPSQAGGSPVEGQGRGRGRGQGGGSGGP